MLSIGKLAAGQAKYYLEQAEVRVDVVDSVAGGLEDYYLSAHEARGLWVGSAGPELGLTGAVTGEDLRSVLAGLDPRDGASLRTAPSPVRVSAFDLTFSAPKSVSVLFGLGGDDLRGQVRAAHDHAGGEALGYLERSAAAVRRGAGGKVVEEASGLVAAGFRHRTSRAGDPQLHTHLLVANLGRGRDGRWSALDGRRLYAHARAASFIYQAVLRAELTRNVGVDWLPVRGGIAEVLGVPRVVREAFSRRRTEIESALEASGSSSARAAETAALATRRRKDARLRPEDLFADWRARAAALGFGRAQLMHLSGRAPRRTTRRDRERLWTELAGPLGLTRDNATFTRRDVIQALFEAGVHNDARAIESAADAFLRSRHAVALIPSDGAAPSRERLRRRDGRSIPASGELVRYSTPEHLALERALIERLRASSRQGTAVASRRAVERAIASRSTLSAEQERLVRALCLDGDGVSAVAGKAGTGKTYALAAAREAWQAAGYPVLGVAVARRAARELQEGAGIQSTSVAALLGQLRLGAQRLPAQAILVVDEAGMVPTRDLAELLDWIEAARGKLVLVGDHRQLPELEAGGCFRGLVQRGLALELTDNLRQIHVWERRALDHIRDGQASRALALYDERGRITVEPTEAQTRERMVEDWLGAADLDQAVMVAHRRVEVSELNALARARLCAAGAVHGPELDLRGGRFAVGDRVVIKRNDRRRGVDNGDRGLVLAVDLEAGSLLLGCGDRQVTLDVEFLSSLTTDGEPTLLHGYAITGHVAQGMTVDRSYVLVGEGISQEWAYVALSRGRESNHLYLAAHPDQARAEFAPVTAKAGDPIARLAARLQTSAGQVLAIDAGREVRSPSNEEILRLEGAVAAAERECRAIDARRHAWIAGLTGQRSRARERERHARAELGQARRVLAERAHGALPHEEEREERARMVRLDDRAAERATRRERRFGREL